ncbi:hypothetical protein ACLKA7_007209 [Drosophila subpalustris]
MTEARSTGGFNYKTLLCTNIPELFLDKFVARTHFGRFGTLVNFVLRPRRMTCTVSYASESEAAKALEEGNVYNGHEFEMCYAENETTPAQKTEEWVDPDVQAELSALSAVGWRNEYSAGKTFAGAIKSATTNKATPGLLEREKDKERERERERERDRQRAPAQFKAAKQELENILRKPAHSSEDKYRVLDARDKLMRLKQRRGTADSQRLQGHCPDMCPEKERVLREFQRQVAIYELQPDSDHLICHELALKQYSRSSADQETPLPHELRDETSLHMTMSYLMHEIMDISEQTDSHLGDWFHFVWDRTRSIRKEITQQELCSLGAVKLVEQCARFHIHCAARLVAEDPSVFDTKINAENLTKCLQTLKYMYHDLRLKGVQCPREAEFRGYIVLLNLADANFLWDIGQLPVELQSCPEIRRAIQFYLALQDTNFVRFFQLLREPETSYLEACILVTYFTRLRILALQRLLSAYRAPRKYEYSSLPVSYIRQMLVFPNDVEADEFLESCDLNVNESGRVFYTSIRIHPPEHYKLHRQIDLVESKRKQSVGECICGEPLPPKSLYQNHRPHNSFNEQGYLKTSAWTAKDQLPNSVEVEDEPTTVDATPTATEMTTKATVTQSSTKDQNLFKVPLFSAPISPKIKSTTPPPLLQPQQAAFGSKGFSSGASSLPQETSVLSGNIFETKSTSSNNNSTGGFSFAGAAAAAAAASASAASKPPIAMAALAEQQRQQQQKAAEEAKLAALQQAIAAAKQREMELLELQKAKAAQIERARQERQREQQQLQQQQQLAKQEQQRQQRAAEAAAEARRQSLQRLEATREAQCEQLLHELIDDESKRVCVQELQLHRNSLALYKSLLDDEIKDLVSRQMLRADYELGLMRHYWRRWRSYRRVQQQKDELFACLPLSFGGESSNQLLDMRSAEQPLRMIRRYRQGEPCDYRQLLAGIEDQCWLKLDLWELLAKSLQQQEQEQQQLQQSSPGARRFFKLLLSLPVGNVGQVVEHALDRGLLQQPLQREDNKKAKPEGYINGLSQGVALCVHKLKGLSDSQQHKAQLANADGIVCYVNAEQLQETCQRLQFLSRNSNCGYVALIVQQRLTPHQQLQLQRQLQLDNIRTYRIFNCRAVSQGKQKLQLVALLQCAVQFLAKQPHRSRGLLQQSDLRDWLLLHLGDELFQRLRRAVLQDVAIGRRCRQSPQFCAQLYNEAVRRLQLVAGESLEDHPQFPQELRAYVEPVTPQASLTNRLEYFVNGWQLRENRAKIVQLLEQIKLPAMLPLPAAIEHDQARDRDHQQREFCEWLLNYAQQSQDETLIETVALRAIQTLELQMRTGEINYLEMVEIFARERLQFVLRHLADPTMPTAIVYRRHSMHRCYGAHWYYEWQPPDEAAAEPEATVDDNELEQTLTVAQQAPEEELSFDQVLSHAQAVLDKCQDEQQERRTLHDHNGQLDKLERTMERFERTVQEQLQQQQQLPLQQHQRQQQQPQRDREHEVENLPATKRQRLSLSMDESKALLDRTERLLSMNQTSAERRLQLLQRAKKFL